jgi:hypothetical protein
MDNCKKISKKFVLVNNVSIHILILFTILSTLYIFYISKVEAKSLNKLIINFINKLPMDTVSKILDPQFIEKYINDSILPQIKIDFNGFVDHISNDCKNKSDSFPCTNSSGTDPLEKKIPIRSLLSNPDIQGQIATYLMSDSFKNEIKSALNTLNLNKLLSDKGIPFVISKLTEYIGNIQLLCPNPSPSLNSSGNDITCTKDGKSLISAILRGAVYFQKANIIAALSSNESELIDYLKTHSIEDWFMDTKFTEITTMIVLFIGGITADCKNKSDSVPCNSSGVDPLPTISLPIRQVLSNELVKNGIINYFSDNEDQLKKLILKQDYEKTIFTGDRIDILIDNLGKTPNKMTTEINHKIIEEICIVIGFLIVIVLLINIIPIRYFNYCNDSLIGLLGEMILVFGLIGIIEVWFFSNIASKYVPTKESLIIQTFKDKLLNIINGTK